MKLAGPLFQSHNDPQSWVEACRFHGYGAAACPLKFDADDNTVRAYDQAARQAQIVIAEVGAWSNPLSRDEPTRKSAIEFCQRQLDLAERIGARCCVNIAGSLGEKWDGPHADDLTPDTYDQIVQTVRQIIDAVRPTRTFYALETMPWMFPNSAQCYLQLLRDIDRPQFAVHLDPVNLVNSPHRFFFNADLIHECFQLLGPHIKGCHAKDIALRPNLTVHLDEVRPGLGGLDYVTFLREMDKLPPDTPLMLEHLPDENEYALAAQHIRDVAISEGIVIG